MVRKRVVALLVILSLVIGASGMYGYMKWNQMRQSAALSISGAMSKEDMKKIEKVYETISEQYVSKVDHDKMVQGAIDGMVSKLNDPFTSYMDKKQAEEFTQSLGSSFQGIGAEVSLVDGKVTIVSPFKDSPAEKAGLKPNDQIVKIDGKSLEGLSLNEAVMKIRGKKGSTVALEVARPGEKEHFDVKVVRDDIPIQTVYSSTADKNGKTIGIIQITSFSEKTAQEFEKQLKALEDKKIGGLVIDVRGNPGGYLNSVQGISDLIIENKKPFMQVEDRNGKREAYQTKLEKKKPYPIVGLIDGGSASASEILAGALKEAGGYPLVGEKSFGKGTVQQTLDLGDGSELKLTMFKWLTPDGNWIHKKGIQPTVNVKQPDYFYADRLFIKKPLTLDMNNSQVKSAQVMLSALGFEPGRKDGYFNEQTKTAVTAFQQANQLPANGVIDEQTAGKLEGKIVEKIRDKKNDLQMQAAVDLASK